MPDLSGHRALVTGASSGIGRAIAMQLAAWGCDVVLTARRRDRLDELAGAIGDRHGASAEVIECDLSRPEGPALLWEALGEPISICINNAGFGAYEEFVATEPRRTSELLQLNVTSLVALSHDFCHAALERGGRAYLLNVASVLAFAPMPYFATYCGSKSFVRSFSESLAMELAGTPVSVTCVAPGGTRTEFSETAGQPPLGGLADKSLMSAQRCARIALRGMLRGKRVVVPGVGNKLTTFFTRFAPRGMVGRITAHTVGAPERALPSAGGDDRGDDA